MRIPKRPAIQFYPKEWIWDLELRQCSPAARGLWVDLMCLMHEGEPYGHLTVPLDVILRVAGLTERAYRPLLAELETDRSSGKRVAYRTDAGVIYSKRMVRDEERRAFNSLNGRKGGNPNLVPGGRAPAGRPVALPGYVDACPHEEGFDAERAFTELWNAYPAKGRVKRPLSQQYFCEKVRAGETADRAIAAVKGKWAASEKWAKGFVLALPEWINQECWNEDPEPAGGNKPGAPAYHKWEPPKPTGDE